MGLQFEDLHEVGIREEFRRVSDEEGAAPVFGPGLLEPAEQVFGPEFPVHETQTDHHSVQDAELGKLRGQSVIVQHHD